MSERSFGATRRGLSKKALVAIMATGLSAGALGACTSSPEEATEFVPGTVVMPDCYATPKPTQQFSPNENIQIEMRSRTQGLQIAICKAAYGIASDAVQAYQTASPELQQIRNAGPNHNMKGYYYVHVANRQGGTSVNANFATKPSGEPDMTALESISIYTPHTGADNQPIAGIQDALTMRYNAQLAGWSLTYETVAFTTDPEVLAAVPHQEFKYFPYAYNKPLDVFESDAREVERILTFKTDVHL